MQVGQPSGSKSDASSGSPTDSSDGQCVAWARQASNATSSLATCPTASSQALLQNMLSGSTRAVSPAPGAATACGAEGSRAASVDDSGSLVAFETDRGHVEGDQNEPTDIFLWTAGSLGRVSEAPGGGDPAAALLQPVLSGDGKQLAFVSAAPNIDLSFPDNNDLADVLVADLDSAAIKRL